MNVSYIHAMGEKKKKKAQDNFLISQYQSRLDLARKNKTYSLARLDIIIIALCSGGIVVILNIISELYGLQKFNSYIKWLLISSTICYLGSIFWNIVAQKTAILIAESDINCYKNKLLKSHDLKEQGKHDDITCWQKHLKIYNALCYVFMGCATAILIVQLITT